jgi:transcriptional regulator with XRE-family HTH domain
MTPRARLGLLVAQRRKQLQLSASEAARLARVSRGTWIAVEKAERETEEYNYAGFERALQWRFGSVAAVLAGGEPTPGPEQPPATPSPSPLPAEVRRWLAIMADPDVPPETKRRMRLQMRLWVEQVDEDPVPQTPDRQAIG